MFTTTTPVQQTIDKLLAGKESEIWKTSLSNEFGRLAQGIGKNRPTKEYAKGTNTIRKVKVLKKPKFDVTALMEWHTTVTDTGEQVEGEETVASAGGRY